MVQNNSTAWVITNQAKLLLDDTKRSAESGSAENKKSAETASNYVFWLARAFSMRQRIKSTTAFTDGAEAGLRN